MPDELSNNQHLARALLLKRLAEIDAELRSILPELKDLGVQSPIDVYSEIAHALGHPSFIDDLRCDYADERCDGCPEKRPETVIPDDVLSAGRDLFTTDAAVRTWLQTPAGAWAGGKTPQQLIDDGKKADVIGALKGLAAGNFL